MTKKASSYRLTEEAHRMIALLTKHLGLSQASVIELAVRELTRKHKLEKKVK